MFNKKKVSMNQYDFEVNTLFNDLNEAEKRLTSAVNRCITRKNVIDLYPDGADKKRAQSDFETAQKILLSNIGAYDNLYNQIINYPMNKCVVMKNVINNVAKSHEIVEIAYRNYFKKD